MTLALLVSLFGCGGGTTPPDAPTLVCDDAEQGLQYCYMEDAPDRGRIDRVGPAECIGAPELTPCTGSGLYGDCVDDSECTEGTCAISACGCTCQVGCETDADCGAGEMCACPNPAFPSQAQVCVTATCTSADECGGYACGVVQDSCGWGYVHSSYCRTASDRCEVDGDCADNQSCLFTGTRWECTSFATCDC